jgi:hypothetical protein
MIRTAGIAVGNNVNRFVPRFQDFSGEDRLPQI